MVTKLLLAVLTGILFYVKVENGKKTLVLQGTKSSAVLKSVLTEIYHLKKGTAVKYTKKNKDIRPFESGGETSLEFFSMKTDCSLFVVRFILYVVNVLFHCHAS